MCNCITTPKCPACLKAKDQFTKCGKDINLSTTNTIVLEANVTCDSPIYAIEDTGVFTNVSLVDNILTYEIPECIEEDYYPIEWSICCGDYISKGTVTVCVLSDKTEIDCNPIPYCPIIGDCNYGEGNIADENLCVGIPDNNLCQECVDNTLISNCTQVCQEGQCEECFTDNDCPEGQICEDGVCVDDAVDLCDCTIFTIERGFNLGESGEISNFQFIHDYTFFDGINTTTGSAGVLDSFLPNFSTYADGTYTYSYVADYADGFQTTLNATFNVVNGNANFNALATAVSAKTNYNFEIVGCPENGIVNFYKANTQIGTTIEILGQTITQITTSQSEVADLGNLQSGDYTITEVSADGNTTIEHVITVDIQC